jgi:hypothetical protein
MYEQSSKITSIGQREFLTNTMQTRYTQIKIQNSMHPNAGVYFHCFWNGQRIPKQPEIAADTKCAEEPILSSYSATNKCQ